MNVRMRGERQNRLGLAALAVVALCAILASASGATRLSRPQSQATVGPETRYRAAAAALSRFIEREMRQKKLSAFSVALVDRERVVWARGFGYADPDRKTPATAETVYRVGAISSLLTDVAVLRLVERRRLDLDVPIGRYLPGFHPRNPFATPITLRDLLAWRSGLGREPPVGSIYDSNSPSLGETVASLNRSTLVYWPSTHAQDSDAAGAVAGYLLESTSGQAFADYMEQAVLAPMGMRDSSFAPPERVEARLAKGQMWTYDGLDVTTPAFRVGVAPAEGLYSSALDLGRFVTFLFASKRGTRKPILERKLLDAMWTPQFGLRGDKNGYGFGFRVTRLDGHQLARRSGSIYGFSSELALLPKEKLGVVAMTSVGGANGMTTHVAEVALRLMLAARHGHKPPEIPETTPLSRQSARSFAGRYGGLATAFDLVDQENRLFFLPVEGGPMVELRRLGSSLIEDGRLGYGIELAPVPGGLRIRHTVFPALRLLKPKPMPARWKGLIGQYGWDYAKLYVLEKDGELTALVDWYEYNPLREISRNVFRFPPYGHYDGEQATFTRDASGVATKVRIGNVVFPRRKLGGVEGEFFHIHPVKPIAELRREALAAKPPVEKGVFRKPDLVDVTKLDPKIKLDIRYATSHDFLGAPVYTEAKAFMQRPAAEALVRVAHALERRGYGLLIHDAYRPWYVTKIFWDATPPDRHIFVANPSEGSRHNRGCAVDLTLYDLATGRQVPMTGHYDEMTERSYAFYPGGTSLERWDRNLLRRTMESEGFTVYQFEWWHFDYKGWRHYPILNLTFEQISRGAASPVPPVHTPEPQRVPLAPASK